MIDEILLLPKKRATLLVRHTVHLRVTLADFYLLWLVMLNQNVRA